MFLGKATTHQRRCLVNSISLAWKWLTTSSIAVAGMEANNLHVPSLDGSRAVSILFVLLAHYISERYFPGGLGVQIFFVISGLLITRLMFAEREDTGTFDIPAFSQTRVSSIPCASVMLHRRQRLDAIVR